MDIESILKQIKTDLIAIRNNLDMIAKSLGIDSFNANLFNMSFQEFKSRFKYYYHSQLKEWLEIGRLGGVSAGVLIEAYTAYKWGNNKIINNSICIYGLDGAFPYILKEEI